MALESLDIRVRQQGARTVARDVRNIGFAASAVTGRLSTMQRVLQGLALAGVTRRIAALSDSFTNLRNRVGVFAESQAQANATANELVDIANRARVATDSVSLTFLRLSNVQDQLGLSTERTTRLVETLSKAVTLGGSSAQEANGALRQFSQGLATDFRSSAQELNSVLEQTPSLAKAIADGLGITTVEIKALAAEGRLSAREVIQAIESQAGVIEARFSNLSVTFGQAFTVLTNSLEVFIGKLSETSEVGELITGSFIRFSRAILRLALDEERLNAVVETTKEFLLALVAIKAARFALEFGRALDIATASGRRFIGLQLARVFRATGVQALFASRSLQGVPLGTFASDLAGVQGATGRTGGIFRRVFGGLGRLIRAPISLLGRLTSGIASAGRAAVAAAFSNPFTAAVVAIGAALGALFSLRNETVALNGESVQLRDIFVATFQVATERIGTFITRVREAGAQVLESLGGVRGVFNDFIRGLVIIGIVADEVFSSLVDAAGAAVENIGDAFSRIPDAFLLATEGDFAGARDALLRPFEGDFADSFAGVGARIGQRTGEALRTDFLQEIVSTVFEGTAIADRALEIARQRAEDAASERGRATGEGGAPEAAFALSEEQEAVSKLIAEFDIGTDVALEFLRTQQDLEGAVKSGTISIEEQAAIVETIARDRFRRLAAETDSVASATLDYRDAVDELTALATQGAIGQDELTAAIQRQRQAYGEALLDSREFQQSLSDTDQFLIGAAQGFESFTQGLGTIFSNTASLTEDLLDRGLSAIDEFVTTGKLDFEALALDVVNQIQKVINRLLVAQALRPFEDALAGQGGAGGLAAGAAGGLVAGGPAPGPFGAETAGADSGGLSSIVGDIFGGGRRGPNAKGQSPADPVFVATVAGTGPDPVQEALQDQTAEERGLFGSLRDKLGELGTSLGERLKGLGTSILDGIKGLGGLLSRAGGAVVGGIGSLFGGGSGGAGGGGGGGAAGAATGITSQLLGSFFGGGLQDGGSLGANAIGRPFLVGEAGPELFVPRSTGSVVPNDVLAAGGTPPQVNVNVTNVDDPKSVPEAMSGRDGEQVILNVIQRNRNKIRGVL